MKYIINDDGDRLDAPDLDAAREYFRDWTLQVPISKDHKLPEIYLLDKCVNRNGKPVNFRLGMIEME